MTQFIGFMIGTWGRLAHSVLGLALIAFGLVVLGDLAGLVLTAVGLALVGLGLWGHCPLELLAGRQVRTS